MATRSSSGAKTAGHLGLWTTNGTAAGTQELTGIVGAATTGIDPTNMIVFNNEVLFNDVDTSSLSGLWVTDVTAVNQVSSSGVLVRNTSGPVSIWEMNGNNIIDGGPVADPGPNWRAVGTGDFNGDGHSDILMQNTDGRIAVALNDQRTIWPRGPTAARGSTSPRAEPINGTPALNLLKFG